MVNLHSCGVLVGLQLAFNGLHSCIKVLHKKEEELNQSLAKSQLKDEKNMCMCGRKRGQMRSRRARGHRN
jgi:hypothetical protein